MYTLKTQSHLPKTQTLIDGRTNTEETRQQILKLGLPFALITLTSPSLDKSVRCAFKVFYSSTKNANKEFVNLTCVTYAQHIHLPSSNYALPLVLQNYQNHDEGST